MQEPLAFLNGRWIPASAAAVPVSDAGFILGATVAEQLRTFAGRLFHLDDHLARLFHSLEIMGLKPGMTPSEFAQTARELVARNHALLAPGDDLGLSIFVTPGTYPAYGNEPVLSNFETHDQPPGPAHPTVCLHTYALPFHLWARKYREGQALVTTEVEQVSPRCWPAGLKCRSRMHYYLADRQAAARDPQARALLLDAQGFVTEASTANLLIYRAGEGLAWPPTKKVLRGISLSVVVELVRRFGIAGSERELTTDDVASAGEVFLSSTPLCLLPVTRLNGRPIGMGRPGELFERLIAAWSEMAGVDIVGQAERFSTRKHER
jgi:branched-subunit amino acid aminotransferase/4-amino-4-deoxychorismate lyase